MRRRPSSHADSASDLPACDFGRLSRARAVDDTACPLHWVLAITVESEDREMSNTTRRSIRRLVAAVAIASLALLAPAAASAGKGGRGGGRAGKGARAGRDQGRNHPGQSMAGRGGPERGGRGQGAGQGQGRGQGQGEGRGQGRGAGQGQGRGQGEGRGQGASRANPRVRASLVRTHIALVVARAAVKRGGTGRDRFRVAALHQRAAGLAAKRGAPRVALHLTRKARALARQVIALNRANMPARAAEQPGEFNGASPQGASRFLSQARKGGPRKQVHRTLGRSQNLLGHAARSARRGGKGRTQLRRAAVYQRAARAARQRGDGKAALHLTLRSRKSAREALVANGSAVPPDSGDQAGEFDGASAEGTEEYVAAADSTVTAEVDEQEIASWDEQPTDDLGGEATADADAELDVETYEYELDAEVATESEAATEAATDGEAAAEAEATAEGEAAAE
jgi:hypothetical protein